jgi:serine protease DegQ
MRMVIGAMAAGCLALTAAPALAQSTPTGIGAVLDPTRGVLTFQPQIGPALDSVVRIVTLSVGADGKREVTGNGSGAVIDAARGLILTNNHVVAESQAWRVEFLDGRSADATLVGADPGTDVAVLKVTAKGLRQIEIANSDAVQVGDLSFAVGYPMGLDQTVTMGIVSGMGRSDSDNVSDYIQTDAPINSGNSGGPLLDSRGRLIGMNTSILTRNGGNIGIGFSIPSSMALAVADQLERNGHVRRGQLGVSASRVTSDQADAAGLASVKGARLDSVDTGSAADKAGLKVGDIVISVDGRPVAGEGALRAAVGVAEAGSPLSFTYVRDKRTLQARVVLTEAPTQTAANAPAGPKGGSSGGIALGLTVRDMQASDPYPSELKGAFVDQVIDGSPAAQKGLQHGDVIVMVGETRIESAAALVEALKKASGQIRLVITRGNSLVPIVIGA